MIANLFNIPLTDLQFTIIAVGCYAVGWCLYYMWD